IQSAFQIPVFATFARKSSVVEWTTAEKSMLRERAGDRIGRLLAISPSIPAHGRGRLPALTRPGRTRRVRVTIHSISSLGSSDHDARSQYPFTRATARSGGDLRVLLQAIWSIS